MTNDRYTVHKHPDSAQLYGVQAPDGSWVLDRSANTQLWYSRRKAEAYADRKTTQARRKVRKQKRQEAQKRQQGLF